MTLPGEGDDSKGGQHTAAGQLHAPGGLVAGVNDRTMPQPQLSSSSSPVSFGRSPVRQPGGPGMQSSDAVQDLQGLEHPLGGLKTDDLKSSYTAPPRRPMLPTIKDRSVTWGTQGSAPVTTIDRKDLDDDVVSHMSNPDFQPLSQQRSSQFESEAEAYIQRTLDVIDPTKAGPSEAQQSILGFVPEDTEPEAFEAGDAAPKVARPTLNRRATTHARTATSTAEDLFQLTNDLSVLNQQHGMSVRNMGDSLRINGSSEFTSDQDKLIKNAATLMKRNNVASNNSAMDQSGEFHDDGSPKPKPAAHDRWNALKNTVHAHKSMRELAKKTDDDGPGENLDTDDDIESSKEQLGPTLHEDADAMKMNSGRTHAMRATRRQKLKSRYRDLEDWLKVKKLSLYAYVKFLLFFLILPAIGVAAILYYLVGNPPCGTSEECNDSLQARANSTDTNSTLNNAGTDIVSITKQIFDEASTSWWVLFVCCRQPITLSLALATQAFIIEFLALRTKWAVKTVGPFVTLFIVQSKGWPFILFWWGVYDFVLLYGSSRSSHWLFWQSYVDLFNDNNPSGNFTSAPEYKSVLVLALVVSVVVAAKRFWVGFWFGKKTYQRYADDLTTVMKKSLLIGQVAALARDKETLGFELEDLGLDVSRYATHDDGEKDDDGSKGSAGARHATNSPRHGVTPSVASGGGLLMQQANLSSVQKIRIEELLGAWEEPDVTSGQGGKAPIAAIIQFRQSLSYLNTAYPFSGAFGPASDRKSCIASAEAVYTRLLGKEAILRFDMIASLAINRNGAMDEEKLKALIKLFRPDRDGSLGLVDFAKSVDSVYKELRLLRASVANSTKMDASFETLFNVVFYFIIICVVLSFLGIDPIVLFASVSGFVIGFAFMIGSACAKYFEGVLFIIVRKPYDIGDRINVSNPMVDTPTTGSPGWIVKDVDLFTTTVLFASTNEVATYSNSTLAACRIINGARSPKASVIITVKFPLDSPYKKLQVFKGAIEEFIKARPREWRSFNGFRASRVEVDFGFVEYSVFAEHREPWQHAAMISQSKADLTSFCLELSKKMNMRYRSPPKPVDLTFRGGAGFGISSENTMTDEVLERSPGRSVAFDDDKPAARERSNTVESVDWRTVSAMFEQKK